MSPAKVVGVIALKGGVGKTSVVANLGATFAKELGKKTLIVDANFSTPHLGLHVGLLSPNKTLHHVLNGQVSPFEAIYEHSSGMHIMPGMLSPPQVNPLLLKEKIDSLREYYDYIFLDSSPSLNDEIFATMAASDELLVVSSAEYPTLSATLQAINLAKKKNAPIKGIIINKSRNKKFEISKEEIESTVETPVLAVLPDDMKVTEALYYMSPITDYASKREISKSYKKLADLITNNYEQTGFIAAAKKALKKRGERRE